MKDRQSVFFDERRYYDFFVRYVKIMYFNYMIKWLKLLNLNLSMIKFLDLVVICNKQGRKIC